MAKASDNEFPSVLFVEQAAAPATPGAGLWRAFFKADGLYVVDDAGTVTGPFGGGGGGGGTAPVPTLRRRMAGDVAITSTAFATIDAGLDITLPAVVGDTIMCGFGYAPTDTNANILEGDIGTVVSGAVVNRFAGGSDGLSELFILSGNRVAVSGVFGRVLVSGDISGGNVTLRPLLRIAAASPTRTVHASAGLPLSFWAENRGQ